MGFPVRWAVGRGLGLAFRNETVYKVTRSLVVNHASAILPTVDEAWGVLYGLSDCERTKLPVTRSWPETPLCDLSVVVPCYNAAPYVGECLDSILGQTTSKTFEVVCYR